MSKFVLEFNMMELISLLGMAQSIYVLVYMALRSEKASRAALPLLFFTTLSIAFFLGVAQSRWETFIPHYSELKWAVWAFCTPLSTLLILQVIRITKTPAMVYWSVLLFVPVAYMGANLLGNIYGSFNNWLILNGVIVGALSLLLIWSKRSGVGDLYHHKNGRERFWLIVSLMVLNIGFLAVNLLSLNQSIAVDDSEMIRVILGISFVYIASTSLFRLYPQSVSLNHRNEKPKYFLSDVEIEIALKIENLLHFDKIYQEPSYGRSDLARELAITDSNLSKIVNLHFDKSVPQLLNTYRVAEAKVLLAQTKVDITVISQEAGFNSIATFNRLFKEIEGVSPSVYRNQKK